MPGMQPAYLQLGGQQAPPLQPRRDKDNGCKRWCIWLLLALMLIAAVVVMGVKLSEFFGRWHTIQQPAL
jgi:hypothetical protein